MIVLVCGGRDYNDRRTTFAALDRVHRVHGIEVVVQGGARGADEHAKDWAFQRGVHCAEVRAYWTTFDGQKDRGAGPKRNVAMKALKPDAVVAMPGGRGTAHMVATARQAGIRVWHPCGDPSAA